MDRSTVCAFFEVLSSRERFALYLMLLEKGPLHVQEITDRLHSVSRSAVSYHLRVLKAAGLVSSMKEGQLAWYDIDQKAMRRYVTAFLDLIGEPCFYDEENDDDNNPSALIFS